jgi:uncharacterized protein
VCVFAKPPVAGRVKTRLAEAIGDQAAAELAAAMLRDVWESVCRVEEIMPVLAASEQGVFPQALRFAPVWLQGEGDLGARMEHIFRRGLEQAPAVIAVGSDVPQLTASHVRDALRELQGADAVIGPSPDGGYYLLGLKRCPEGLLADLSWSCSQTRQETEGRLRSYGFRVATLEELSDVDVLADLAELKNGLPCGSATSAWLERYLG